MWIDYSSGSCKPCHKFSSHHPAPTLTRSSSLTEGDPHGPHMYLSVQTGRRSGLLYVPAEVVEEVKRRVEATGRIDVALAEISAINLELFARGALD